MENWKVFTDSDLDGVSCAIMFKAFNPLKTSVTYTNISNADSELFKFIESGGAKIYDYIFITDLSLKQSAWNSIMQTDDKDKFIFIDHHASSEPLLEIGGDLNIQYADINERPISAAELTLDILKERFSHLFETFIEPFKDHFEEYVKVVSAWDTFTWKNNTADERPVEMNMLRQMYTPEEFTTNRLHNILMGRPFFISAPDKCIITHTKACKERYIDGKLETIRFRTIGNFKYGIIFAEQYISELGNSACEKFEIDIAAIINPSAKVVSLRTVREDISLAVIAKGYGGGGHRKAAGFVYSDNAENVFIDEIF